MKENIGRGTEHSKAQHGMSVVHPCTHLRPRSSDMRLAELPRLVGPDPVPVPVPGVGCALFGLLLRPDATLEAFVCIVKSQPLEAGGKGERTAVERTAAG